MFSRLLHGIVHKCLPIFHAAESSTNVNNKIFWNVHGINIAGGVIDQKIHGNLEGMLNFLFYFFIFQFKLKRM